MKAIIIISFLFLSCAGFGQKRSSLLRIEDSLARIDSANDRYVAWVKDTRKWLNELHDTIPQTDTLGHDIHYDTVQAAIMYYDIGKVYKEHHIFGYVAKAQGMPDTYNLYFDNSKKKRIDKKQIISAREMQW